MLDAVLLHTYQKQALPKNCFAFLRIFLFLFFSNTVTKPFFKIIKIYILIKERLQRLLLYTVLHLYTAFVDL